MTYIFHHGMVPRGACDDALGCINYRMGAGFTPEQVAEWKQTACWFPDIVNAAEIQNLLRFVPKPEGADEVWTQILLQFPAADKLTVPDFHLDDEIINGKRLVEVANVPLTLAGSYYGGLTFRETAATGTGPNYTPGVGPCDIIRFTPDEEHHGGVNHTPLIRYAVYFRWVTNA